MNFFSNCMQIFIPDVFPVQITFTSIFHSTESHDFLLFLVSANHLIDKF